MSKSRLSVLMSNYNHSRFLPESIEAIVSQSRKPDELVIIDDGSTDDSVSVIESFVRRHSFIRFLRNDRNRGVIYTANRAFQESSGDYVYWASADDRVLPGFFEKSMEALLRYPRAGLCCSLPAYFVGDVQQMECSPVAYRGMDTEYFSPDRLERSLRQLNLIIAGHTAIIKRDSMEQASGFLHELRWHCDWFAIYVIGAREGICYVPESLAAIRIASGTYSTSAHRWSEQRRVIDETLRVLESPAYSDVAPFFRRSGILAGMPGKFGVPGIVLASIFRLRRWRYLTVRVLQHTVREFSVAMRARILSRLGVSRSS